MSTSTTSNNNNSNSTNNNASSSSRWCPTPEQLMILEELYRSGVRTPNASHIQRITAHLSLYGKIEGKNVFYWFQNHKARDRQKLRRKLIKQLQQQQQQQQLIVPQLTPDQYLQLQQHQSFDNARRLLLNYFEYPNDTAAQHPRFHEVSNPHLPPPPPPPPPHHNHYQQAARSSVLPEGGASSRAMMFTTTKKNQMWNDGHHQRHNHDHVEHMIPSEVGFGGCQMAAAEDNSTVMARMNDPDRRWIMQEADEGNDDGDDLDRSNNHNKTIKTLPLFPVTSTNLIQDRSRRN